MDDEISLPFIIRSKLHRPQMHGVLLQRQQPLDQLDQRRKRPLTLISAPAGYGKTTLECLTNALQLAEPSGFIRPFVDLGPRIADLLKRLHKQKIAVNYIEKILTAFEQEGEQRVVPEPADQPTASARQPRRPSPPSQPLVEPLTNRELDVLDLPAQRLSSKEIAEKLFISTTTVKTHLQNIYGKLNVGKRREAVEHAENIGILKRR